MTSTTGATIAALQTETRAYPAPAGDWNVGPEEAERLDREEKRRRAERRRNKSTN